MNNLKWNEGLITGNTIIDNQHRELFNQFNALYTNIIGDGTAPDPEAFESLCNLLSTHLSTEDKILHNSRSELNHQYKDLQNLYHERISNIRHDIHQDSFLDVVEIELSSLMLDVIISHTQGEERENINFLKKF